MRANPVKILIATILLLIASTNIASAFECDPRRDATQADIKTLYENADNVVFVQITKGELLDTHISYTAKVIENLKGNAKHEMEIIDYAYISARDITIGSNYIIYLYGNTEIDFCTPLLPVWTPNNTIDELIDFSERADIGHSKQIRETLIHSKILNTKDQKQPTN